MILDDIIEKIEEAKCPDNFAENLNIGQRDYMDERNGYLFEFYPCDTCSSFAGIRRYQDNAYVTIHSHGITVDIDGVRVRIHNSQIIVFDYYLFDDSVEYKRSDSRADRVGLGLLLAGPVGAAVGLASSFGKGKKRIRSHNLVIAYWNLNTKEKEIIDLEDKKGLKDNFVPRFVEYWQEQVKINEETGREPKGDYNAGVGNSGCLGALLPIVTGGLYLGYKLIECIVC